MVLDTELVKKEVLNMRKDVKKKLQLSKIQYSIHYNYLYKNMPTLFDMVYKDEYEYIPILDFYLKEAKKVRNGTKTQHDGDVDVGNKLANEFIHPVIPSSNEDTSS